MPDLASYLVLFIFVVGYLLITLEHFVRIDKATVALLTGISAWAVLFVSSKTICVHAQNCINEHIINISQVVFFLMGALAIVELISLHKGFTIISNMIQTRSHVKLLWLMSFITFFLSAILDNLTTTIVMVALLQKLIDSSENRLLIGGAIVIAANAGGAWTPIGDVTTTMLWISGQLTTIPTMRDLFFPSFISLLVSTFILSFMIKETEEKNVSALPAQAEPMGNVIFFLGLASLMFVPIFKVLTGLPPFMGILFSLSVLWIFSDLVHRNHPNRQHLRMGHAFTRIEFSNLLFFFGILLAIGALDAGGLLNQLANWLNIYVGNHVLIATFIGLASAVVDNIPLVAGTIRMYPLEQYPSDHSFWQLIAYCAGTGGSVLIIGSAAGVLFMGLEKVDFFWYLRRISLAAILGYFAGIGLYILL